MTGTEYAEEQLKKGSDLKSSKSILYCPIKKEQRYFTFYDLKDAFNAGYKDAMNNIAIARTILERDTASCLGDNGNVICSLRDTCHRYLTYLKTKNIGECLNYFTNDTYLNKRCKFYWKDGSNENK